ncbi:MAG: DUF4185 domain-containing protein [Dehalococcoidia bacterium]|nr:DUF4185 domain-containing protein [Dehalococcoidia bacterium]
MTKQVLAISLIAVVMVSGCFRPGNLDSVEEQPSAQDVVVVTRATKIGQLVGDYDREREEPTLNLTWSRYKLAGTDLGVPFQHKGRTYLLFGDTVGLRGGDAIAYTTDTTPEDGIELEFIHDEVAYKVVDIPGISQGAFEVPVEGVSIGGRMFIYHTTDSKGVEDMFKEGEEARMGRSVVAVSDDDGKTFTYLYDFSSKHFINVSVVEVDKADLSAAFTQASGEVLFIFGSGAYRRSDVRLAAQPPDQILSRTSVRYFAGLDGSGRPTLNSNEEDAQPLFSQPCVGELSVTYNRFIDKWIMLYNCFLPASRGINMRTADKPWGPWSEPQIIFHPWDDNGYCHFMHASWRHQNCDSVHDPRRENEWAGEYGPYQFEDLAVGDDSTTTIYFTMSTWNPYTVVLMGATLQLVD